MKKIIAILLCLLLSACAAENPPVPLPVHNTQIVEGQSVLIRLNEGSVTVRGGEDGQVRVAGKTLSPDQTEYNITTVKDQIQIVADYTGKRSSVPPVHLEVSIPNNITLTIETDSASIVVREYTGELEAAAVSGDILVEDVHGYITLRSNRGDVMAQDSVGRISIVGNYGLLSLDNAHGDIGVSTIMGKVVFSGSILMDDDVRLETDHGAVSVHLGADSALDLQVRSTSGDVTCLVPGMTSTTRTCDGTMNTGGGGLSIRTVSGAVTLQLIP
jgi:DUF4097 and DUF4098 domain-containing protein YvlB